MRNPRAPQGPPNKVLQDFNDAYDPDLPVSLSFSLVSQERGWKTGSKRWRKAWNACMNAEYDRLIGPRVSSLAQWQELCAKVGIEETLPSITKCKKALAKVHVNLIDLLDGWNYDSIPTRFKNQKALAAYTAQNHKYFGRDIAKQDKFLMVLLRKLL